MGMSTAGAGARKGRRGRGRSRYQPMSEINVTPFVDVMLVLLIIFMVAGAVSADTQPITISVDKEGRIFLQETEIGIDEVTPRLAAIAGNQQGEETRIFVRGDKDVRYDLVARVLADISSAGFKKITLSSVPSEN